MLSTISRSLAQLPRTTIMLVAFSLVMLIGVLDFLTGSEMAFSIFYLLPISVVAWALGNRYSALLSVTSALVWIVADVQAWHRYSSAFIPIWNTATRLAVFLIVAELLSNLRSLWQQSEVLSHTDALTGIVNRRAFTDMLHVEMERFRRYRHPFTLAYVDVDDFKQINDRYGHSCGDDVLRAIAAALNDHTRSTDTVARLGGDEFAVLLRETGEPDALHVLATFSQRVRDSMGHSEASPTLSIGAITFYAVPPTVDLLIQQADTLMYTVKTNGKAGIAHHVVGTHPAIETALSADSALALAV